MKKEGFFICVEGLDGCGKTTQTKLLVARLKRRGYDAVYTSEPSRGKIGAFIRRFCLHGEKRSSSIIETLLFAADRFEHVENEIAPAVNKGRLVVSDRYVYSSLAYQGAAGLDLKWIESLNVHALRPDLALFIDTKPGIVMKRLKAKRSLMENLENQLRVREVYVKLVERGDLVSVDGNQPKMKVAADVTAVVLDFLEKAR